MLRRKGEKSNRSYVACLPNLVDESLTFLFSSSSLDRKFFSKLETLRKTSWRFHFFLEYNTISD